MWSSQCSTSVLSQTGVRSNRFRYRSRRSCTAARSLTSISRRPRVDVWSGTLYFLAWYSGLLFDGHGLKPTSYSFIQFSARW